MKDRDKSKEQLICEIAAMRQRIAELGEPERAYNLFNNTLYKHREWYQSMLDEASDLIQSVMPDGRFYYVNKTWQKTLGYNEDEIAGITMWDIIHPDHIAHCQEVFQKVMYGQPVFGVETVFITKNGKPIPVEGNANCHFEEGKPIYTRGIFRDITERKQVEGQLKEYSENLERMVEERTRELKDAQSKIVRTEKLAAIGELAGSIAHELRNPLGVIKASTHFFKIKMSGTDDEKLIRHLDILEKQADLCNSIITDLLDFSRPGNLKIVAVDIDKLVREVLQNIQIPQNIEITTNQMKDPATVMADRGHLERVFSNLVINSIESMPDGGKLFLSTKQKGSFIEVTVADTGTGISEDNMDKIFEPLFTTKAKGVGLGLSLAKALIEKQEGTIDVQSQTGKGTTFTIKLPIDVAE